MSEKMIIELFKKYGAISVMLTYFLVFDFNSRMDTVSMNRESAFAIMMAADNLESIDKKLRSAEQTILVHEVRINRIEDDIRTLGKKL